MQVCNDKMKIHLNNDEWFLINKTLFLRKRGCLFKITKIKDLGFNLECNKGLRFFNSICSTLNIALELVEILCNTL